MDDLRSQAIPFIIMGICNLVGWTIFTLFFDTESRDLCCGIRLLKGLFWGTVFAMPPVSFFCFLVVFGYSAAYFFWLLTKIAKIIKIKIKGE